MSAEMELDVRGSVIEKARSPIFVRRREISNKSPGLFAILFKSIAIIDVAIQPKKSIVDSDTSKVSRYSGVSGNGVASGAGRALAPGAIGGVHQKPLRKKNYGALGALFPAFKIVSVGVNK
jgi:hypothetical protein